MRVIVKPFWVPDLSFSSVTVIVFSTVNLRIVFSYCCLNVTCYQGVIPKTNLLRVCSDGNKNRCDILTLIS